jgi:fatty acid desaturase
VRWRCRCGRWVCSTAGRVKITLTISAFVAGWALFVIAGNSWTTLAVAPLVGVMFTQLGFIGHDAGHGQVFGGRRRNRLLGLIAANVLIGLSFGWWVHKHNAHHAHPNEMGRDPDIGDRVAPASPGAPGNRRGPLASWLARWQAPLFFPLMLLRSSGMHVLGIKRLLRRRDRAAAAEGSLLALHAALYLTVVLNWGPGQLSQVLARRRAVCLRHPHRDHVGQVDDHAAVAGLAALSGMGQDQAAPFVQRLSDSLKRLTLPAKIFRHHGDA